jgi:galacturan 1,4-alpha-galacturonidase
MQESGMKSLEVFARLSCKSACVWRDEQLMSCIVMQTSAVQVGNISFINIEGTSATEETIKFACSDTSPCEGLYLENIFLPSYFGGDTRSYCWQAHGSAQGYVYPPACFSNSSDFLKQNVLSESNTAINSV